MIGISKTAVSIAKKLMRETQISELQSMCAI